MNEYKATNYIRLNKYAYDKVADDYFERLRKIDSSYAYVCKKICEFILDTIQPNNNRKINVLELGCGPGGILRELNETYNFNVCAVDISSKMLKYARLNNPNASLINGDILKIENISVDDSSAENNTMRFDIIIMMAFIHIFTVNDAKKILKKVQTWLNPNGLIYLDTTIEDVFIDGELTIKKQMGEKTIWYLRTKWTKETLFALIEEMDFIIVKYMIREARETGKKWLRIIIRQKDENNGEKECK